MFDIEETKNLYLIAMLEKAQKMVDKIDAYPFIKTATLQEQGIQIEFNESVDLENQEILDLFIKGGVIKKTGSKDKEEDYIKVNSIGAF